MRTVWGFSTAGRLTFGRGAVEEFAAGLSAGPFRRAFIISDPVLGEVGHVGRVSNALSSASCTTESCLAGAAEPAIDDALSCIKAAHQFEPDLIVGLGGGSNLDLAKITATVMTHGGRPHDYFGFDKIPGPVLPVAAMPTTAGTGSEVSHSAVLTDTDQQIKVSTLSQYLRPAYAIVDPSLTDSAPPQVTADSGIDALVHAIEAYTARRYDQMDEAPPEARAYEGAHPLGKTLAAEAIRLVGANLATAVHGKAGDSETFAARDAMALAATYAGMAFSNCGVAIVHGLEYPIGALTHCSHGAGNGCLLPYVMQFNLAERTAEIAEIGKLLGLPVEGTLESQAQAAIDHIVELRRLVAIPHSIREFGVTEEHLDMIAEKTASIDRLMTLNPRAATKQNLLEILTAALG